MELVCVDPVTVHQFWPFVRQPLYKAIHRADISLFRFVESAVLNGNACLWLVIEDGTRIVGQAVTQIEETERGRKVCTIVAASGNMSKCLPLKVGLEKYAGTEGCQAIRIYGRQGWMRMLPDYRTHMVILEKDIA